MDVIELGILGEHDNVFIFVIMLLVFVIVLSILFFIPADNYFVVESVEKRICEEINDDHDKYITYDVIRLTGFVTKWKGDKNNSDAIKADDKNYGIIDCKNNSICSEIKKGDILLLKIYYLDNHIVDEDYLLIKCGEGKSSIQIIGKYRYID